MSYLQKIIRDHVRVKDQVMLTYS